MLAHPTLEHLETLGLQSMAKAFAELSAHRKGSFVVRPPRAPPPKETVIANTKRNR